MPKLLCPKCRVEYRSFTSGVNVIEMFNDPPEPYKIWLADLWVCPGCGGSIVSGFAFNPVAEHFQDHFKMDLEKARANAYCYEDYEKLPENTPRRP